MSSPASLHFPNAKTITESLSNHPLLKTEYYLEKGITPAIVQLLQKDSLIAKK